MIGVNAADRASLVPIDEQRPFESLRRVEIAITGRLDTSDHIHLLAGTFPGNLLTPAPDRRDVGLGPTIADTRQRACLAWKPPKQCVESRQADLINQPYFSCDIGRNQF
jgi:hypothetical protein